MNQSPPNNLVTAAILATGSELVLGQMVDTNSSWLSGQLTQMGLKVTKLMVMGDDMESLIKNFRLALTEHQIVLVTGGLGPTEDDLTRVAVARAFDLNLEFYPSLFEDISNKILKRGFAVPENNYRQAWLPGGSIFVPNELGSAPAFALERGPKIMIFMPGVPAEMKGIVHSWVKPKLREKFPHQTAFCKTEILKAAGLGESKVDQILGDLIREAKNPNMGLLAGQFETKILITAWAKNEKEANILIKPVAHQVKTRLEGFYFGKNSDTIFTAIVESLNRLNLKLFLWDELTEGRLAEALGPLLNDKNHGGILTLPPEKWDKEKFLKSFLSQKEPGLALYLKKEINSPSEFDQEISPEISMTTHMHLTRFPDGLEKKWETSLKGPKNSLIDRSTSLISFHLWQFLQETNN
jgi:nicotinamide-nucleotide amidase